jgi:ABC-type glycerol-3-phosphate transport system substrate-binding protein
MARDKISREEYLDIPSWLWKNKLYAIPFQAGGEVFFYNKKLLSAEGINEPTAAWTWDDMLKAAQKLTKRQGDQVTQWGLNVANLSIPEALGSFILNNGGKVLNDARDQALYGDDPQGY